MLTWSRHHFASSRYSARIVGFLVKISMTCCHEEHMARSGLVCHTSHHNITANGLSDCERFISPSRASIMKCRNEGESACASLNSPLVRRSSSASAHAVLLSASEHSRFQDLPVS